MYWQPFNTRVNTARVIARHRHLLDERPGRKQKKTKQQLQKSMAPRTAQQSWITELVYGLSRCWLFYNSWRIEQAAINELASLSDRELKDIGLYRCEIMRAVRNRVASERPVCKEISADSVDTALGWIRTRVICRASTEPRAALIAKRRACT